MTTKPKIATMQHLPIAAALAVLIAFLSLPGAFMAEAAPFKDLIIEDGVYRDPVRNRDIAYRSYSRATEPKPAPVILLSHGVGGARDSLPFLAESLAGAGYAVFVLEHKGSNADVWKAEKSLDDIYLALRRAMWDGAAAQARFGDATAFLTALTEMNRDGAFAGRLDLKRIGMAGHSYGAVTTMVALGQRMGPDSSWTYKEPRIKAGIVLSPSAPIQGGDLTKAYREIEAPIFHITGTRDANALPIDKPFDPAVRTIPFRTLTIPNQYLLVLDGAGHNDFSGLEHGPHAHGAPVKTRVTDRVAVGAVLFFDAFLKGSAAAKKELETAFPASLAAGDRFERK